MAPACLVLLLLVFAAPASAAPIRLTPASGEAGREAALRVESVAPRSIVQIRIGDGQVKLLLADGAGRVTTQERMPGGQGRRVRVAVQDARGRRAVMHYRVRSRWSAVHSAAASDWSGRKLRLDADLRRSRLVATARLRGLTQGKAVQALYDGRRRGVALAGGRGRARIRATLPGGATGRTLTLAGRGLTLETVIPTPPARIVATGDIACRPPYEVRPMNCQHAQVAALTSRLQPDAVVLPGDIQYRKGTMRQFRRSFHRSWGKLDMPLRPAPGNHEYLTPGAEDYFDYFEWQSGWRPPPWYAVNVGSWRLLSVNSNCVMESVDCSPGVEQEEWLRANLAAEPYRCTLAYWHHPRFSSGFHGSSTALNGLWGALDDAEAELVVVGHDHHYERFAPQNEHTQRDPRGMREFVVGLGGAHPSIIRKQDGRPQAPHSEYAQNKQFGVLLLKLYEDAYRWRFVALGGRVLDSGNGRCI
ncbi:MAG TPA: metallophosphoesterase [Thermoleophilaceae bacterium]|nr:metallophosphoesterase [Thermoleophilaceae bacterium]